MIFFEDPHVARQHEADIQLLERAVCVVTASAICATSPSVARRWAVACGIGNARGKGQSLIQVKVTTRRMSIISRFGVYLRTGFFILKNGLSSRYCNRLG